MASRSKFVARDSWMVNVSRFIQIIGQISRLRCASLEMTTKWISARHPTCSTTVESSLQIGLFYAKRTQFRESPNERKHSYDKGL